MSNHQHSHVQGFDIAHELSKIYGENNTFKLQREKDLACYFNLFEFAEYHDIDGKKFLGVFTTDTRAQKFSVSPFSQDKIMGVSKSHGILFLRCEDIDNVYAEQPIKLDGRLYQIDDAVKLGNVIWRISLSANVS